MSTYIQDTEYYRIFAILESEPQTPQTNGHSLKKQGENSIDEQETVETLSFN